MLVAYLLDYNLQLISIVRRWRGEFGDAPPFDIGPDTLVVGYSLWAEMICFMTLGWKFPAHVYDLHTAFLSVSISFAPTMTTRPSRSRARACRMLAALTAFKVGRASTSRHISEAIGQGRWREYGQPAVFDYCEEDVRNSTELFRRSSQVIGIMRRLIPNL